MAWRALKVASGGLVALVGIAGVASYWSESQGGPSAGDVIQAWRDRSPGEWIRYLRRDPAASPGWHLVVEPVLARWQQQVERPVDGTPHELVGLKGQRVDSEAGEVGAAQRPVATVAQLAAAIEQAEPGTVIEIGAGRFELLESLVTRRGGTPSQPIVVRARRPGTVELVSRTVEAIIVSHPYWQFEHLSLRGACASDDECEHAFHVVAGAHHTTIRNNRLVNFNSHIKVNGAGGQFPDDGVIQANTLLDEAPRRTGNPATPIDIVAASRWQVLDNLVADFAGVFDLPVYGIFMKGAGSGGRIERNLVVCSTHDISRKGVRIGISLGGGGTDTMSCRDRLCAYEHIDGVVANNIVAHCNDHGLDANRALRGQLVHNTLINTAGVLVRGQSDGVVVRANLFDGGLHLRQGSTADAADNRSPAQTYHARAQAMDFGWTDRPPAQRIDGNAGTDFCGAARLATDAAGALASASTCATATVPAR